MELQHRRGHTVPTEKHVHLLSTTTQKHAFVFVDDAAEDPMFDGFASAEIGSMPELMALLQDDEILDRFQVNRTLHCIMFVLHEDVL